MQQGSFETLLEKFLAETITPQELDVLLASIKDEANQETLNNVLAAKLNDKAYNGFSDKDKTGEMFMAVLKKADEQLAGGTSVLTIQPRRKHFSLFRLAAAAVITGLIAMGVYFLFVHTTGGNKVDVTKTAVPSGIDVQPGGNKATLLLADGTTIILDSAKDGALSEQGNTKVIKLNEGQLAYHSSDSTSTVVLYNTISTPKGGTYQVILPDETKVWLNAESSLRFPTAFTGKERSVEITGEAYFEVATSISPNGRGKIPFIVHVNASSKEDDLTVEVLGTHFNIMAYDDEKAIKTTLLEGAVKVSKNNSSVSLQPSQQATLTKADNSLKVMTDIDADEETAWINGMFQFNGADLSTILRQLSRWYDVDVSFVGNIPPDHFTGRMPRNLSLSKVLKILELSGVHFRIEGRKIVVTS